MVELLLLLLSTLINTNKSHTKHFENAQKRIIIISLGVSLGVVFWWSFTDCNYHGVHRQNASPFGIIYILLFFQASYMQIEVSPSLRWACDLQCKNTTVWITTDWITTVGWDGQSRLFIPKEIITPVLCWFKVILLQKSGRVNFVFGFNLWMLKCIVWHAVCLCQRQSSDSVWIHWCLPLFGWLWVVRTPICRIPNSSFGTICIIQKQTT